MFLPSARRRIRYKLLPWLPTLALAGGCAHLPPAGPDKHDEQIAILSGRVSALANALQADRTVVYELVAEMMCPSPRVRSFFESCPSMGEEGCHIQDLTSILGEMVTLDHAMVYYYPGQDPRNPDDERKAMIKNLVRRHVRRPTTRLLVVALPANLPQRTPAHSILPLVEQTARALRQLVSEYYVAERRLTRPNEPPLRVLPATGLTCNHPAQVHRPFLRLPENQPLPTEPHGNQPQIIAWAFLVDC